MWAALFSKDFLEVPLHEAVGMAASASVETGLDVDEMDVEGLEDLEEMKKDELVTSSEESSDDEDLFKTMVDADMLGREEVAQKANIDPEARKSKDVAKLLGAICTIRKADEMRAKGMAVLEEIVGKYPDLAGLAEIIKPAKNVIDKEKTPVTTSPSPSPSQPPMPKEAATVVASGSQKLYPSSHINTLGIRIFQCPACEKTFRNHGTADAHIRKEHTKIKYGPCTHCGFTSWNGDSFWAHSKKHQ